jgi:hypothetical protein
MVAKNIKQVYLQSKHILENKRLITSPGERKASPDINNDILNRNLYAKEVIKSRNTIDFSSSKDKIDAWRQMTSQGRTCSSMFDTNVTNKTDGMDKVKDEIKQGPF